MSSSNSKPIVVKVMRLVKPFFEVENLDPINSVALPGFNSLFSLPQNFGTIYLGQKFSAYVSVINKSDFEMKDMDVQVELKNQNQRYILPDEQLSYQQRDDLETPFPIKRDIAPGKNYCLIVQKPMLELGEHTISVIITYTDSNTFKKETMKKNFKFYVLKPIDIVIHNVPLNNKEQLIHLEITNTTEQFININKLTFKAKENIISETCSNESFLDDNLTKVAPNSIYSYTFKLKPNEIITSVLPHELGCITILWYDEQGEQGYLQTSTITSEIIDQSPIVFAYIHIPASIQLMQPLNMEFSIQNITSHKFTVKIDWSTITKNLRIIGEYNNTVQIDDHETLTLPIQFLPLSEGEFKMPSPKVSVYNEIGEEVTYLYNSSYILIQ